MRLNQITLPAVDIPASVEFYRALGFELIVSSPHYARFRAPVGGTSLSVHVTDAVPDRSLATVYLECEALDAQVDALVARGFEFLHGPMDQPWLWREARLADPSGNVICLYHAGENRLDPPWRVPPGDR